MSTDAFNVYRPVGSEHIGYLIATDSEGTNRGVVDLLHVAPEYRNVVTSASLMRDAIQRSAHTLTDADMILEGLLPKLDNQYDRDLINGQRHMLQGVIRLLENANLAAEIGIEELHIRIANELRKPK